MAFVDDCAPVFPDLDCPDCGGYASVTKTETICEHHSATITCNNAECGHDYTITI